MCVMNFILKISFEKLEDTMTIANLDKQLIHIPLVAWSEHLFFIYFLYIILLPFISVEDLMMRF